VKDDRIKLTAISGDDTGTDLIPGSYAVWVPRQEDTDVLNSGQLEGDTTARTGLAGLETVDEITMVCIPDAMSPMTDEGAHRDLQNKVIAGCENQGDRMAILDPESATTSWEDMRAWRSQFDSKFATMYYPWIEVMDPLTDRPLKVPPCGHVAGLWARVDSTRGVHKAPANEVVLGANGLAFQVTAAEQGFMNKEGINCIRSFPGRGIRVWGARTISSDPEWRYINVRRLFNYISESIMEGTQWAVFEPNDSKLWTQLKISATNFLTRVWRDGALFGTTPDQAFYVKCDEETNPPDLVEAGQVTVEIGIAPVKPAEFVVFRISQFQVGAEA
jgi:phage tail sheath protein FI